MNCKTIKRLLVTIGVTAGFITVSAAQVSAGLSTQNYSEPTLHAR